MSIVRKSTKMVHITRLFLQKKLLTDFLEVLSEICRGLSGQGHRGSTTLCVLVQHRT